MICLSVNQLSKSFLSNQLLCLFTTSQPAPFGFFNLFFFLALLAAQIVWSFTNHLMRQFALSAQGQLCCTKALAAPHLLPHSWPHPYVMALQCQSGSGTKPIYSRVLILQWPEGQQAADYLTGNTSCIVLNFAWSHWPGYFFIIHGNGRKAAKWIHTHASI